MSSQDALLKRIALGSRPRRSVELDAREIADRQRSVIANVQKIVSSRQGSSKSCPDYGVPDLDRSAEGFAAQVTAFANRLADTIEEYEPRLRQVRVTQRRLGKGEVDPDPLHLTLEIKGLLVGVGSRHRARIVAKFSPDGRVRITGA